MAIKHIVTAGFGFADGTIWIPTRGYSIGEVLTTPLQIVPLGCQYAPTLTIAAQYEPVVRIVCQYAPTITLRCSMDDRVPEQPIYHIRATDITYRFPMDPPRSILGWSVTFSVKYRSGGTALIEKTVGSGVTLTDTTRGVISVVISKANTTSLTPTSELADGESYNWDLKRTDVGLNVVLARGEFILEREVTA